MEAGGGYSAQGLQGVQQHHQQQHQQQQPGVVPYTIVNVAEPPRDHVIWSLICFVYSNPCCLGLAALIFSIKARDRRLMGDLQGAHHYGSTARCLNIVSTVLVCLVVVLAIISAVVMVAAGNSTIRT